MSVTNLALFNLIGSNREAFANKVIAIADKLGANPDDLMKVMYFESKLNPAAKNPVSSATGLIQFTSATARDLGTSVEALRSMSNVQQLDYVYRYLLPYKKYLNSLTNVYLTVFYPKALSQPSDYKLPLNPTWVTANKIFDINKDGVIQKSEIAAYIDNYYKALQTKLGIPILRSETLLAIGAGLLLFFLIDE